MMMEMDLLTQERQTYIHKCLQREGRVIAADLAESLNVSVDTIRRDLRDMASLGLCQRVYGGALPPAPKEANFLGRQSIMPERKVALAAATIDFLQPGMHVFIDAGTTNLAIAQAIPGDMALTVLTNAPSIAAALLDHDACQIVVLGGQVDKQIGAAVGARTVREIEALNADLAILGTCGFDVINGLSAHTLEESEVKRAMAMRSRVTMAALTNDKLETAANYNILPSQACGRLILEFDSPEPARRDISALGIDLVVANRPASAQESI
ncbi:DeoR/GlpR family DNA-binding transcription regulator [Rhizobium sp. L1K21]|uniref:DeoR/GlpR family DNA-binding transcription regulator n=1 Tax=Rhizobium sp. L1K21 TaxID=2954933 RepID=UPI002093B900|nr:DeoR/GlpR family DNA-binding transcription regulator [Rhizobium sp. L1K21]MCO6188107.1 DeoR/GlpR family DNA-binding transcription regulator [Rhizobium sp. L1K21]